MAHFKVIVPRLNVRKAPVADFADKSNIITTVGDGLELELDEVIDFPTPSLGRWFRDSKNQYYSEKGLREMPIGVTKASFKKIEFNPTIDHWWITDYGIDKIWVKTRGAGVRVAVIDTGLDYNHTNIKNKKNIEYYNVIIDSDKKEDSMDAEYHGTMCAGIIAAQGPDIYGIAPESDLIIIKATKDGSLDFNDLIKAIDKAVELSVDIISISYDSYFEKDDSEYLNLLNSVRKASERNILIVASTGNTNISKSPQERYPASFIYCLSVGSIAKGGSLSKYIINENLDILAPGENVMLLDKNNTTSPDSGTSYSAPYVVGICALYLSLTKNRNIEFLKSSLKTDSSNKDEIKKAISEYVNINIPNLGIINPAETIII